MLALYFDKEFIRKFELRNDLNCEVLQDFYNSFLRKIRGVEVYVNATDIDEVISFANNNEFYNHLSEIATIRVIDFVKHLHDKNFYCQGAKSKIFFLENENENELQTQFNQLFISNNTLKEKWCIFQNAYDFGELIIKSKPDPNDKIYLHSWKDLEYFIHPIRNLIFFDLYILGNKDNQKIKDNILPCLMTLLGKNNPDNVEIKIFTSNLPRTNFKLDDKTPIWLLDNIKTALSFLNDLNKKTNRISLIKYDKTKVETPEHDRFIITNYFYIEVGSGFNIFKTNKDVNHSSSIKFNSILINKYRKLAKQKIEVLNEYTSKLKHKDSRATGPGSIIEHYLYYPEGNHQIFK
ncbi:MAG: hypothetical protein CFE25_05645 [Chitinophagaceae bacterium BSSC1]|nr:MAG: hypothetical protein CFE25_05645 [Chitinophagaceae bacterium BSSC1]